MFEVWEVCAGFFGGVVRCWASERKLIAHHETKTMNIASILRHWFTLLATLLTGWLVLPAEQQAELTKALGDLVGPLVIVLTLVITAVWRIALAWIGKVLRTGSGELENGGPSGGAVLLLMIGTMAALAVGLPSCASSNPNGYSLTGSLMLRDPNSGAKGGLVFKPGQRPTASLKYPVYDPKTGELLGMADLTAGPRVDRASGK